MTLLKAFATVNKGMEKVLAQELLELNCKNCDVRNEFVIFEVENYEQLCELCYTARSPNNVLLFLTEIKIENIEEDATKQLDITDFTKFLAKENNFKAGYEKSVSATQDGREIATTIGGIIQDKTGAKVNLTNPELQITCFILEKEVIVGIDFCGEDLGKRDYRIFLGQDNLKGNTAFCLLKLAEWNDKKTLLDPFCRSGSLAIEAALSAKEQPVHYYNKNRFAFLKLPFLKINFEKMFKEIDSRINKKEIKILCYDPLFQNLNSAKKNAKIAGVIDEINFSRSEIEWLDIKFEKNIIDCIVTYPLQATKVFNGKKIEKVYLWLFKNAKYLLKKNGVMLTVAKKNSEELLTKFALEQGFSVKEKQVFYQGAEELKAIVYQIKENL